MHALARDQKSLGSRGMAGCAGERSATFAVYLQSFLVKGRDRVVTFLLKRSSEHRGSARWLRKAPPGCRGFRAASGDRAGLGSDESLLRGARTLALETLCPGAGTCRLVSVVCEVGWGPQSLAASAPSAGHCHWEARPPAKPALKVRLLFTPHGPQNEEPGSPHLLSLLQTSLQSPSLSLVLWEMGMILVT